VLDEAGRIVWRGVVDTHPEALSRALQRWGGKLAKIGLESGSMTPWLVRELAKVGFPMVCMDARAAADAVKSRRVKSDNADAYALAEMLRTGWYPNSTARKTSGSSCGRTGCRTEFSNPSTTSSIIAATPGTRSSISRGKSCPSRAAIGQPQVTQSEDGYKFRWSTSDRAAQTLEVAGNFQPNSFTAITASVRLVTFSALRIAVT